MSELILTCGIPASGKSTWTQKQGLPIVSRDVLRQYVSSREEKTVLDYKGEEKVTELEQALVRAYLKSGVSVIVDNMHLRPKYIKSWAGIARECNAEIVVQKFPVSVEDAVQRNALRENGVPESAIREIARKFTKNGVPTVNVEQCLQEPEKPKFAQYVPDKTKPKAIIVDLDGTLAHNNSGRGWYALGDAVYEDDVDEAVQVVTQSFYDKGYAILFVSGRDERVRPATERWLEEKAEFNDYTLLMRPAEDKRKDAVVKLELFDAHIRETYNVSLVIDDRRQVTEAWRSIGLKVWQVAEGDY